MKTARERILSDPCFDKRGSRMERLQALMAKQGTEAVLLFSEVNRFYLTGVQTSNGAVIVTADGAALITDSRYFERAQQESHDCEVVLGESGTSIYEDAARYLREKKIRTVEAELERIPAAALLRLKALGGDALRVGSTGADCLMDELRRYKDRYEMKCFLQAQKIADRGFAHILNFIRPGVTERDIRMELGTYMVKCGSQNYSMGFITVSGPRTSLPHGAAGDRMVEEGDFVTMDFGGMIGGYSSDMTRTVAVGYVTDEQAKVYATVLEAQQRALDAIRPGKTGREIDSIARSFIDEAGYKGYFGHGLGHSLGLEIHEFPRCSQACDMALEQGETMTVEPGIYLPGRFGVRIEDMGVLTADGFINMAESAKNLIVL